MIVLMNGEKMMYKVFKKLLQTKGTRASPLSISLKALTPIPTRIMDSVIPMNIEKIRSSQDKKRFKINAENTLRQP